MCSQVITSKVICPNSFLEFMHAKSNNFTAPMHNWHIIIWLALRAGKMNQIVHCDWLLKWARWRLGTIRCIPQAKFHQKPYNKSFIDQVCSFLHTKKELGQYPAILTKQTWSITHTSTCSMIGLQCVQGFKLAALC